MLMLTLCSSTAPMIPPGIAQEESQRLQTLRELRVLDTPFEERFDRLTRLARRLFDVPIALVSLVDEERQWFKSCQGLEGRETSREISFCGHAILQDGVFVVPDARQDPRFSDNPLVSGPPWIRFYAGRPLLAGDRQPVGTLCLIDREPRQLDGESIATLNDLAQMAEDELAAFQLAVTDELTGMTNRRGFLRLASYSLELCRRHGIPAALIFLDLDGLKQVNDSCGHAAGDTLLRRFAERLAAEFRTSDLMARLGGDEFVVLITGAVVASAAACLQRLAGPGCIPFSCGIVRFDPQRHPGIEELLAEGDARMYAAKRSKRDAATP